MKNTFITLIVIILSYFSCWSQQMTTTTYRDLSIPYIELNPSKYNFAYPIKSDILDSVNFSPPTDGLYLLSTYGHRYLSNTSNKTDNHGGFDFWPEHTYNGVNYDSSNKPPITCMCDGFISQVVNGPDSVLDLTGIGRSVRVTCDSLSQAFGGTTRIYYRHLSSLGPLAAIADTAPSGTISIQKGDVIGIMGESGITTNVHLHLSSTSIHPVHGNSFLSTARLFDPALNPQILKELTDVKINLLHNWADSALFRIIWPYNQTINQFEFINQSDTIIFNKEEAYQTGSTIRDNHDCVAGIKVFAYQFNGKRTAQFRYLSEMNNIPAIYPASPQRDTNLTIHGYQHIPITHDSVAYVYDFIIKDLSPNHLKENFIVKLSDVWGYTVEGTFPIISSTHELKKSSTKIYPNPVISKLNLVFEQKGSKTIYLFDVFGRLILSKKSNRLTDSIHVDKLSKGMYLLKIESQSEIYTYKILKE